MMLSIIILTWNSEQHIEDCIFSLIRNIDAAFFPYEIFIVDNGSKDATKTKLDSYSKQFPGIIKNIFLKTNHGTTFARNLALKQAMGDYIAIIDSDVMVTPDFLPPLVSFLDENQGVGMVVPQLVYADGSYQKSTDDFPTFFTKFKRYFFLKEMEKNFGKERKKTPQAVDYAISAFWLMKKGMIKKIGLLDEKMFYAPEDVDYCLRMWKQGYKIFQIPDTIAIHDAREVSRNFKINKAVIEHFKGLLYLFRKHRYFFRKPKVD